MEAERELAIVDYHFLIKEFEQCKKYQLVVPYPHIKTLENLLSDGKKNVSVYKINQILDYLNQNSIILTSNVLPKILTETKGIKPKTLRFVRYVLLSINKYPSIKIISDSRETRYLLKQLGISVSKK